MKLLLVNERVEFPHKLPSLGLAILATIAKQHGHHVKCVDYQLTPHAPDLLDYVFHLQPEVVGFRVVNENWGRVEKRIVRIRPFVKTVIVGGPYPSLHWDDLLEDGTIDQIFIAEAERSFEAFLRQYPEQASGPCWHLGYVNDWPWPDFTSFHQYQQIEHYPLQMSRGCPHNCSFCSVKLTNSRKWRPRELKDVFEEVLQATGYLPHLERVIIIDDNPTHNMARFRQFLYAYWALYDRQLVPPLGMLNLRADKVTEEIAYLLMKCGCEQFIIGVESVGKQAMQTMHKRISQRQIITATRLLKRHYIRVGGGFIIGLPGDDWESVNNTIDLAKALGLQDNCWGHLIPLKGTEAHDQVTVLNYHAPTMVTPLNGQVLHEAASEIPELPEWWILKAWLRASAKTNTRHVLIPVRAFPRIFWEYLKKAETHTLLREGVGFLQQYALKKVRT